MSPRPPIRGIYRDDPRARAAYAEAAGIYRIVPAAVCLPADVEDLQTLVRWAAEHRVALVPRGAGSAMGGGNVGDGVIVDLGALPRRLDIDPNRRRARTSANVTLAELNAAAAAHGLRLPPDPSSARWATLGGMLSTNAAGARSVRYGSVRRWIEAATIVTADGEAIELRRGERSSAPALARFEAEAAPRIRAAAALVAARFPRVHKNSSGYALDAYLASGDVLDLVIGAEGTLGLVTGIEWRLDAVPSRRAGLRIWLRSLDQLSDVVLALRAADPSAVELLDRTFLDLVGAASAGDDGEEAAAVVLVEIERPDAAALDDAIDGASAAVRALDVLVETARSADDAETLWTLRHAASPILANLPPERRSLQVVEDGCVPVERTSDYIRFVRSAADARDLTVVLFGHAGDGHIHVNLLPEIARPGWEQAVAGLLYDVTGAVIRLGGTPAGEHGDGRLRAALLERVYGAEVVGLFALVKRALDPLGILNPGIILPAGEPPISRLKVGTAAAELPADVAAALRQIEQQGGYARPRLELV
jgi:FAD/FMN-containing dehydrogenase